jgi:negative regulator of flagellin synthesis FlgM
MADKIDGYGRGVEVSSSRLRNATRTDRQKATEAASTTEAGRDAVELTGTVTHLKRIEARLASVPDVDQARVDAIRQRIELGEYAVDPARVARKLLRLEQDLS